MGFFSSLWDIATDVFDLGLSAFTDALSVLGKIATGDVEGAFRSAIDNLVQSNKDMVQSTFQVLPYVAAVVGYIYGGPAGATVAYNLAGGEGMGSSIEKQSPEEWAATVVSAYTGDEEGMLGQVIAMGYGILGPDVDGDGTTFAGQDVFSPEVNQARLDIVKYAFDQAVYNWNAPDPGRPFDMREGAALPNDWAAARGIDINNIESLLGSEVMQSTPMGEAYLNLKTFEDAALVAQDSGVPSPDVGGGDYGGENDVYIIGGDGEGSTGGSLGEDILQLVGGGTEQQDIDITTTTNIQLPSEPAKMPSIRELDNLDQGLFAPGPLVRAKRNVDVARATTAPTPVKSMWNKSGIGITG